MGQKLPDAHDKISSTGRRAFLQQLIAPPSLYVGFTALLILFAGLFSVYYFYSTTGGRTAIVNVPTKSTSTSSPEIATREITSQPTSEPTREQTTEPPAEPTSEPTEEATLEPTEPPVPQLTDEPTDEPLPTPPDSSPSSLNPAALPGKIAAPVFNMTTNTYDLYIASGPDWQLPAEPFQRGASQPAFSPDGASVLFRSWGGETTPYAEQLVIRSLGESWDRQITHHLEDARPHWSDFDFPIVFHSRPSGLSTRVCVQALWQDAPQNPDSRRELAVGEYPTWLPDGRIVYASGEPEGNGLYLMNSDGSAIHKIWPGRVAPRGSPTNNQVVFSDNDDLYLLTIGDPINLQQITETPERERLPVWSPDGQFLAYVKDHQDENWAVYAMRTDGTGETRLFNLPGSIDGKPLNVDASKTFGWYEEQLAWGP